MPTPTFYLTGRAAPPVTTAPGQCASAPRPFVSAVHGRGDLGSGVTVQGSPTATQLPVRTLVRTLVLANSGSQWKAGRLWSSSPC